MHVLKSQSIKNKGGVRLKSDVLCHGRTATRLCWVSFSSHLQASTSFPMCSFVFSKMKETPRSKFNFIQIPKLSFTSIFQEEILFSMITHSGQAWPFASPKPPSEHLDQWIRLIPIYTASMSSRNLLEMKIYWDVVNWKLWRWAPATCGLVKSKTFWSCPCSIQDVPSDLGFHVTS